MVRATDPLEEQLLRLPAPDRARLAELLIDSLDPPGGGAELPPEEADRLWAEEAERRLEELRTGAVTPVPAADVFARLARRFGA